MTTTEGKSVFLDTNILLCSQVAQLELHEQVLARIKELRQQGYSVWISRQIIREFLVQVTRVGYLDPPFSAKEVEDRVNGINGVYKIADETADVTRNLIALIKEYPTGGKQIHDANIVATMLTYGVNTLLTLNIDDFKRFAPKITLLPLFSKPDS